MDNDEKILLKKCQNGDLTHFGKLYDLYIKKIYDFVFYKTNHKEIAEDLTSKVFLKALNKIDSFKIEGGSFQAWLYMIARNTVIDHYRTYKSESDIDDFWDISSSENIERDIDMKHKLEKVDEYLKNLKSDQREILIMRIWQGLSYREIAEILGKSEASCKMKTARVLNKLRKEMPLSLFITLILMDLL